MELPDPEDKNYAKLFSEQRQAASDVVKVAAKVDETRMKIIAQDRLSPILDLIREEKARMAGRVIEN